MGWKSGIVVTLLVMALVVGVYAYMYMRAPQLETITNFEECASAGNPVLTIGERQCFFDGRIFTEEKIRADVGTTSSSISSASNVSSISYSNVSDGDIRVTLPFPGATTGSEFTVRGVAKKDWYMNGEFLIAVFDQSGTLLSSALGIGNFGKTEGGYISFSGDVSVPRDFKGPLTLVLFPGSEEGISGAHQYISFSVTIDP